MHKLTKNGSNIPKTKKEKFKHDQASTIYLQVVGSGAYGAPRSVYIFTEHCRYFFNCGEGTQRLASEHKVKLGMTEHVLITHKTWENVGGLPGALLTLQDTGVPKIMIHGPPGVESLYNDTKNFMRFTDLKISYSHYEKNGGVFDQGPLLIQAVPLWPEGEGERGGGRGDGKNGTREDGGGEGRERRNGEGGDSSSEQCMVSVLEGSERGAQSTKKEGEVNSLEMETEDMFAHERLSSPLSPSPLSPSSLSPSLLSPSPLSPSPLSPSSLSASHSPSLSTSNSVQENATLHKQKLEESVRSRDLALAYICKPVPKRGALLPERCRALGVPLGPLMGELKRGKDVTLPSGNVVKAEQVTAPLEVATAFVVIEIPSKSHLDALEKCSSFLKYQKSDCEREETVALVVHFTPVEILKEERYTDWSSKFPPTTTHIYINENSDCMGSESVHKIQYKLNHLYEDAFPLLSDANAFGEVDGVVKRMRRSSGGKCESSLGERKEEEKASETQSQRLDETGLRGNSCQAFTCLTYHIRPHLKIDKSKRIQVTPKEYIRECYDIEGFQATYDKVRTKVNDIKLGISVELKTRKYPHVLFLGTGSCIPNKMRNTSGIALNINPESTVLLDCGEGTFGQLVRFLGAPASTEFLRRVSLVSISHLHADHHIGLIRVLLARKRAFNQHRRQVPKLLLLAPKGILHYLRSYDTNFESICDQFTLIPNNCLIDSEDLTDESRVILDSCKSALGIRDITTCFVQHCPNAFGVAVTLESGWKMVYSGDTRPCQALVDIGLGCDLLIHEATMDDELSEDARLKRHSTTAEAVEVGVRMRAQHVVLTHFSQRYAKVPLLDKISSNVGVAFDNMRVHLCDLACLSHLYPAYVSIFAQDVDEMLKKRHKIRTRNEDKLGTKI